MLTEKILTFEVFPDQKSQKVPLMVEVPLIPEMLPVVVSTNNSTKYVLVSKLSKDNSARVGVFESANHSTDSSFLEAMKFIKDTVGRLGYPNIFGSYSQAIDYIRQNVTLDSDERITTIGPDLVPNTGSEYRHIPCDLKFGVVFSVPEYVGMYVGFAGSGRGGLIFHNIKLGMAFVDLQSS